MSWVRAWWRTLVIRCWPQARAVEETWRTWPPAPALPDLDPGEEAALWDELTKWAE